METIIHENCREWLFRGLLSLHVNVDRMLYTRISKMFGMEATNTKDKLENYFFNSEIVHEINDLHGVISEILDAEI